jgi:hypothetical protein
MIVTHIGYSEGVFKRTDQSKAPKSTDVSLLQKVGLERTAKVWEILKKNQKR